MAARRLVIVMLVLLGISTLAAAVIPVELDEDEREEALTEPPDVPRAAGELVSARIDARAEDPAVIELRVGDQLALTVRAGRPDQVEIPAVGELRFVGPLAPARFDILAWEEASYAVRLVDADRLIGRIEIGPPRARLERESGRLDRRAGGREEPEAPR